MSEETDEPRPRRKAAWIVFVLLGVLLMYPLSAGPAVWLLVRGYMSEDQFHTIYWPLESLAKQCQPFEKVMGFYLTPWLPPDQ